MKKKVLICCLAITVSVFGLTGCFGGNEEPVTPQSSQENVTEQESAIASETDTENTVMDEEESAYRMWRDLEENEPAFDKNGASVGATELLQRAVVVEYFLEDYPDSRYKEEAVEYYNKLVTAAITGGYMPETSNNHLYLDEEGTYIREDVLEEYNTFLEENGGTKTGSIVEEYVTILGSEERGFTDSVKNFYTDIVDRMKGMFDTVADDVTAPAEDGGTGVTEGVNQ